MDLNILKGSFVENETRLDYTQLYSFDHGTL